MPRLTCVLTFPLLLVFPALFVSAQDLSTGAADTGRMGSFSESDPMCELSVTSAVAAAQATVSVLLTNEHNGTIEGFVFDLCYDDSILDLEPGDMVVGADLRELDFEFLDIAIWDDALTVDAIMDADTATLGAGTDLELFAITYGIVGEGSTDLEFCGDLVTPTLFLETGTVEPETRGGTVVASDYLLRHEQTGTQTGELSGTPTASVFLHARYDVGSYDFSICLSDNLEVLDEDDISSGDDLAGADFDFEAVEITDDGWVATAFADSLLVGNALNAGENLELYDVIYSVRATGMATVEFCGTLGITSGSASRTPFTVAGNIDIIADCDGNGIDDGEDIAAGADDCNGNGVLDACDEDCDLDGVPDDCQEDSDCDSNGIIDACEPDRIATHTSEATIDDLYGESISVLGSRIVVGAPEDAGVGAVYVYRRIADPFAERARLEPENGSSGDLFGAAVWQFDDSIIVGAPGDDDGATDSGALYIFRWDPAEDAWTEATKLTAETPQVYSNFGASLHSDGEKLIVGAPGVTSGWAHVFSWDPIDHEWAEKHRLTATSYDGRFGCSVAIDGDMALVGADLSNCGAVHVYDYDEGDDEWVQGQLLTATYDANGVRFGRAISLRNNEFVASAPNWGAGKAQYYTYDGNTGLWVLEQIIEPSDGATQDAFGSALSIVGDSLYVGSPGHGESGCIYEYNRGGTGWEEQRQVTDPDDRKTGHTTASFDDRFMLTSRGPDSSTLTIQYDPDCNGNLIPDSCELAATSSLDADGFAGCTTSAPLFLRGDVNGDGNVNAVIDALFLIEYGFHDGPDPTCMDAADVDGNNTVSVLLDALTLLDFGFGDAAEPPYPGVQLCGLDLDGDDDVSCDRPSEGCSP